MSIHTSEVRTALIAHVDRFFSRHEKELIDAPEWKIRAELSHFRVCRVHPAPENPVDPWVYLSLGAWEITVDAGQGFEFFLISTQQQDAHAETVAEICARHANLPGGLKPGMVVSLGRPIIPGATVDHLLVTLPYPYGPKLEDVESPPGTDIRILWLLPITTAEAALAKEQGSEALEKKFESIYMDFTVFDRESVV
jgi:hypothetical protein